MSSSNNYLLVKQASKKSAGRDTINMNTSSTQPMNTKHRPLKEYTDALQKYCLPVDDSPSRIFRPDTANEDAYSPNLTFEGPVVYTTIVCSREPSAQNNIYIRG